MSSYDFSGKRDGILVEFDHFADGWRVVAPCEWIRDGFGGCSRGDCGWMVAWLGIVFGTRQFRKYWDYRDMGLGSRLVREAVRWADGDVKLHVSKENPAVNFYRKLGFRDDYLEMRYYKQNDGLSKEG